MLTQSEQNEMRELPKNTTVFKRIESKIDFGFERMISNIKKYISVELLILFLINLFILFASTCCYSGTGRFSIDSYHVRNMGEESLTYISSLRPFGALLFQILNLFGHHSIHNNIPDFLIFIVLTSIMLSITAYTIYQKSLQIAKSKVTLCLVDMGLLLMVLNVYFTDLLSFPECIFIHAIALSMTLIATILFCQKDSVFSYIGVSLLLIAATATYQTYLFSFAILTIGILIAMQKITVKKILRYFEVLIGSGVAYIVISVSLVKFFKVEANSRVNFSISAIFHRIYTVFLKQPSYLNGRGGLFNSPILFVCFFCLFLIWGFSFLVSGCSKRKKGFYLVSFVFCYCAVWGPLILSTGNTYRAVFCLFVLPIVITISSLALSDKSIVKYSLFGIIAIMLVVNIYRSNQIEISLCKQNALDAEWAREILLNINDYEETNNVEIENIAIIDDEEQISTQSMSARYVSWAKVACINEFGNQWYTEIDMPEDIYNQYFKGKNWDRFDADEQLVFIGNTLYICNY